MEEDARSFFATAPARWASFLIGLSVIYTVSLWLAYSPYLAAEPRWIGTGIAVDLTVTATLLFWLTLVRTEQVSSLLMTPFLILSAAIASWLLADRISSLETLLVGIVVAAELAAVSLLLFNLGRVVRTYRATRKTGAGFDESLAEAVRPVIKSELVTEMLVTEASILFHAIVGWRKTPARAPDETHAFSYHKENGWKAVAIAIGVMLLVELVPLHILLATWQPVVAWIMSALTIYSLVWIIGDYHAIRLTPVNVTDQELQVRVGRRWSVDIALEDIVRVEVAHGDIDADDPAVFDASLIGGADVVIEVDREHEIRGPFGIRKGFEQLGLSMDDPSAFVRAVEKARQML